MIPIVGTIRHYAWGSSDFLPDFLGNARDGQPWAELWLGTHPDGMSHTLDGAALTERAGTLPYLLKILAIDQPLSLQCHPDAARARTGFERGLYASPDHKAELLVALEPTTALCGVRPQADTLSLLDRIGASELAAAVASNGVAHTIRTLYTGGLDPKPTLAACAQSTVREAREITALGRRYPNEPSVAVALLLNLVEIAPGECLRINPGHLHAYLSGAGVELMNASDNVVRGGLTVKHVDIDELLRIVCTDEVTNPVTPADQIYELPLAGVSLRRLDPGDFFASRNGSVGLDREGNTFWLDAGDEFSATAETYVVVDHTDLA